MNCIHTNWSAILYFLYFLLPFHETWKLDRSTSSGFLRGRNYGWLKRSSIHPAISAPPPSPSFLEILLEQLSWHENSTTSNNGKEIISKKHYFDQSKTCDGQFWTFLSVIKKIQIYLIELTKLPRLFSLSISLEIVHFCS